MTDQLALFDQPPPTTSVSHPARFSPEIIAVLAPVLDAWRLPVHDPFAGTGQRLGELCDQLGLTFTGTEIQAGFIVDGRVAQGDSTHGATYPSRTNPGHEYVVVTSPVYPNGMTDHFHARDSSRRHTYRQALAETTGTDEPLHPNNMGRYGNRHRRSPASENKHFAIADACIRHWPQRAAVNVSNIVATNYFVDVVGRWIELLEAHSFTITERIEVNTRRQRFGSNSEQRAECETILVAERRP